MYEMMTWLMNAQSAPMKIKKYICNFYKKLKRIICLLFMEALAQAIVKKFTINAYFLYSAFIEQHGNKKKKKTTQL